METKQALAPERRSARDRLLAAADELFYEGSIHTVGIERVIERAGVAKASLYDTFGSKEELIRAYLEARQAARKARISARLATCATPRDRLLGVFDAMEDLMAAPGFRGCAFNRAAAESRPGTPVKSACDDARSWMSELFTSLAREAGAADPDHLACQLVLLYDGASVSGQMGAGSSAAVAAREMAALLLDAATAKTRPPRLGSPKATLRSR
jgi:AcrR family transcriptional regulator